MFACRTPRETGSEQDKLRDMTGRETIPSRGIIDQFEQRGASLEIGGWFLAEGGSPLARIEALVNGEPCTVEAVRLNAPSPGLAKARLDAPGSNRGRYRIRVRMPEGHSENDGLFILLPVFEAGPGSPLLRLGRSAIPLPPDAVAQAIGGAFLPVSLEFLGYFLDLCGLRPGESVLDVGCGAGRIAYGLAHYLKPPGRYEGFDVMADPVTWAQQEIGSRHPHFCFRHVPVYSRYYNRGGTVSPERFEFPYPAASFDFAFLTSVFTHMRTPGLRRYLGEVRRVLKPGGRFLSTFFLLNEESRRLIREGRSSQNIVYPWGKCYVARLLSPDFAVGYDESLLERWLRAEEFEIMSRHPGSWCGRDKGLSYQDVLVIRRRD